MKTFSTTTLSALLISLLFLGCSESGSLSGLSKCEGTVSHNGNLLADAVLTFHPDGSGQRAASAVTDANGKFVVTTLKSGDGITPGGYKVTITKYEDYGDLPPMEKNEDGGEYQPPRARKNILPKKYESSATSGLTASISKGKETLSFELAD